MVVEKPVNMPTQRDQSGDADLLTCLKNDLKVRYQKTGNVYLGLVHRLDRPVGGLMVFAKTSKAASRLSAQVRERSFEKYYYAVARGLLANDTGRLHHHLIKDSVQNIVSVTPGSVPGSKEAFLEYQVLGKKEQLSFIRIALDTGRSHQIRAQFAAIGHPLYGDQKYGSKVNRFGQQLALFSFKLRFQHPVSKELLAFTLTPPLVHPWIVFRDLFEEKI